MKTNFLFQKIDLRKLIPRGSEKGAIPGAIEYVGRKRTKPVKVTVIEYAPDFYSEKSVSLKSLKGPSDDKHITWINISGVHNTKLIQSIGDLYSIHPLILGDISNTTQRPKVEEHDDMLGIISKMMYFDQQKELHVEQVSLVVGKNWVLSFQETEEDVLDPLRNRIRNEKGRIRKQGSDYLTFAILDNIVDHYFYLIEVMGGRVEELEDQVITEILPQTQGHIYDIKRKLIYLKKSLWPMREMTNSLTQSEHPFLRSKTKIFFRDTYNHMLQVIEGTEGLREVVSEIMNLYLSSVSNKMNEVMKMLTVFASIFIPLTFIAGIYGMNFKYMPELSWKWGYLGFWGITVVVVLALVIYFKKKKWL